MQAAPLAGIDTAPDLTDRVYQRVLDAIAQGKFPPGARLAQEELAAWLNVSRQPVHQALRLLKKEGFLVDAGRRGLMVRPLDAESIVALYEVRGALDGLAARLAARRGAKLDDRVIAEGRRKADGGQVGPMVKADMAFHDLIYAASGNPLIGEAAHRHWQHIARAMGAVLQAAGVRHSVWDEHEAMISAIARRDEETAERLARSHCEEAGRNLAAQLSRHLRAVS